MPSEMRRHAVAVLLLTAFSAAVSDQNTRESSATTGAKLRLAVLEWYCAGGKHSEQMPCANYDFLKKLRGAATNEEKRILVTERLKERRSRQRDKTAATAARDSYAAMYKEYCSSGPANPTICAKWSAGQPSSKSGV
mmetsp:Transcript_34500/g.111355  ORF Transcript_34500/g.111355 Transcript_34500/m.111355 type:complete len:137 (+) Transcript_34500:43-453(+)